MPAQDTTFFTTIFPICRLGELWWRSKWWLANLIKTQIFFSVQYLSSDFRWRPSKHPPPGEVKLSHSHIISSFYGAYGSRILTVSVKMSNVYSTINSPSTKCMYRLKLSGMHMGRILSTKIKGWATILLAFLINRPRGEDLGASWRGTEKSISKECCHPNIWL
jgi:hypothetical protein